MKNFSQKVLLALIAGFVIGVLWIVAMRFVTYESDNVHYHANFALYVNGQRDMFDNFTFYEEVQSCGSDEVNNPRTRVHLHGNINHVVHVHDSAATWGHLFANLGYTLGDDVLKTDDGVFIDDPNNNRLSFFLNGQAVEGVANETIRSEDVLLINYGQEDLATIDALYNDILRDASEYNQRNDPSSCAGTKPTTFTEKLKKSFGF